MGKRLPLGSSSHAPELSGSLLIGQVLPQFQSFGKAELTQLTQQIADKRVLDSRNSQAHGGKVNPDEKQFTLNCGASKENSLSVVVPIKRGDSLTCSVLFTVVGTKPDGNFNLEIAQPQHLL